MSVTIAMPRMSTDPELTTACIPVDFTFFHVT